MRSFTHSRSWSPSVVVGVILQALGLWPFVQWMWRYSQTGEVGGHWVVIIIAGAAIGFGALLQHGKGESIADVILGLLGKQAGGGDA